jgi:predicted DNA-binding antitoxin AbrB/MazE fold protein
MTIKVKYENGVLRPLDDVKLEDEKIYEISEV